MLQEHRRQVPEHVFPTQADVADHEPEYNDDEEEFDDDGADNFIACTQ